MGSRFQLVLIAAFGSLLGLTGFAGFESYRRASRTYAEISQSNEAYRAEEAIFRQIESDIQEAGVLVRDYLLDPSHITGALYREQLLALRERIHRQVGELEPLFGKGTKQLKQLQSEVDSYWDTLEPVFQWTPQQKMAVSLMFLRRNVLPRRVAVIDMTASVRQLGEARRTFERQSIEQSFEMYRRDLGRLQAVILALGVAIAVASVVRLHRLERETANQWVRSQQAEKELRRLSQELVRAQEEERRFISRELHDEVGQMLTALRVELGNIERVREVSPDQFETRLNEAKALAEESLRSVRHMSMGLRPAMLDDLGLGPALEWQAREFSRHYGVAVTVEFQGHPDAVPEPHRTCVYRVVQEALTNCARHAQAKSVRILAHATPDHVALMVQDDGVGFHPGQARGLGLPGIRERVRELGGSVTIDSQPGRGALLTIDIPLPVEARA